MIRMILFLLLGLFMSTGSLFGQQANPFDLQYRLPETARIAPEGTGNPFDLVPHKVPGADLSLVETVAAKGTVGPVFQLPQRNTLAPGAMFGILVVVLIFFTIAVGVDRATVGKAWRSFLNENALTIAQRDALGLAGNTPYFLLYANFLLNAGIFIFLIVQALSSSAYNNFMFLLICFGIALGVFLSKHLMIRLASWLLPIKTEAKRYNFLITIFNCVLGLFLVPFNFLIAFLLDYKDFLVFWVIGLAILFYGYRSVRAISIGSSFLAGHQFHFLLYLCTVEIAPLLILIKLTMLQIG
ncbi:MAG: DUF4271 domain-containing protein [Lewinellaceae bacterium]|nr:DUF4271 domain-containing protein [Lewinellaceae bacterium]